MRTFLIAGAALLMTAAPVHATSTAPTAETAPTVELKPASVPRGADIAIPHMEGRVIVDGDTRIRVRGEVVHLLGTSGTAYVVHTSAKEGYAEGRAVRVRRDGSTRVLLRHVAAADLVVTQDGDQVVETREVAGKRTAVHVVSARTGEAVATRTFRGRMFSLDAAENRVLLSSWSPARTVWWNFASDATSVAARRTGGAADITADRLGSYTGDPYDGGCYVLSSLRHPARTLWRSCSDRAVAFSPSGRRVATVGIVDDGIGPAMVTVRRVRGGAALARYTTQWFGAIRWESNTALLLDTNGKRKAATIRCVLADCERASDLEPVPQY